MKKILLLLIVPFLSFGQEQECEYQEIGGFTYNTYFEGSHYYVSNNTASWDEANEACVAVGGHLITINSSEEVGHALSPTQAEYEYWIGLFREDNNGQYLIGDGWQWVTGETYVEGPSFSGNSCGGIALDAWTPTDCNYVAYGDDNGSMVWHANTNSNNFFYILEVECDSQTNTDSEENDNTNAETGPGDNNGDGVVNLQDLFTVLDNWLQTYSYSQDMTENEINATLDSINSIIAELLPEGTNIGDMLFWDGANWGLIDPGNAGDILTISDGGLPVWNNLTSDSTFLANLSSSIQPTYLSLGDDYQGGKVAYIFQEGDPGYIEGQQHGIIAAYNDLNQNALELAPFGCYETELGGTSTEIGSSVLNTYNLISNDNTGCLDEFSAAKQCFNLELNGYDDWVLPSVGDLMKLYISRNIVGGYSTGYDENGEYIDWTYISSSEDGPYFFYSVFFANGYGESYSNNNKSYNSNLIRPIRYF